MSETDLEFYPSNNNILGQQFIYNKMVDYELRDRTNHSRLGIHIQSYAQGMDVKSQDQSVMQQYDLVEEYNDQNCVFYPSMTPPVDINSNSTSENYSSYYSSSSGVKDSFLANQHQSYVNDTPSFISSNVSDGIHDKLEGQYYVQRQVEGHPLTPPLETHLNTNIHPSQPIEGSFENFKNTSENLESSRRPVCSEDVLMANRPLTKWKRKQERERLMLPLHIRQKRRLAANARERKRMTSLNDAFARLRSILPKKQTYSDSEDTEDPLQNPNKELSKMEALQMAQAYISQLSEMLNE